MADLIDRQELISWLSKDPLFPQVESFGLTSVIESRPSVDAEPVRHGHWEIDMRGNWACSLCGNDPYHDNMKNMNYCPNCGAKMDESKSETKKRKEDDDNLISNIKCLECLNAQNITSLRISCSDCGAKMDEVKDDD